ncbi:hypothetical protein Lal_00005303 [Lupinus albus]|nr:hypothetical protein Lal_00005303 [Lupinus albus]
MGGGHKRTYRLVDFKRRKFDVPATVERLEYDPNRTAFIALIKYQDGTLSYILAPQRLKVGDTVISGERTDVKPGNAMPLKNIPVGSIVHNVELKAGKGGQVARSAGTYLQLVGRDGGYAQLKLPSGELRMVRGECMATLGAVSNPDQMNTNLGKAGRNRWLGKRPSVRGVAMNPIDHPHGGVRRSNDGTLRLEGPVRRRLSAEEGGQEPGFGPQRDHQDLVASFDHPAAVRRSDVRRLQRPQVPAGSGYRAHDRSQVRRVRSDADLLWPRGGQEGEEEVSHGQVCQPQPGRGERGSGPQSDDPHQPAEAQPRRPAHPEHGCQPRRRRADLLQAPHRRRGEEGPAGRDRERREQPPARRRPSVRVVGDGRSRSGDEALPRPCARSRRPGREAVQQPDDHRSRA